VLYMLALSLLVHSSQEWAAQRLTFLRRLLQYSRSEGERDRYSLMLPVSPTASPAIRPSRSPGSGPRRSPASGPAHSPLDAGSSGGDAGLSASDAMLPPSATQPVTPSAEVSLFETCRAMLCFFGLIERLHDVFKGARSWQPAAATEAVAGEEAWIPSMRERLRQCDQQVLKELTSLLREFEDEMLQISDFQEFFDVLGVLPEVLAAAPSCDDFVIAART